MLGLGGTLIMWVAKRIICSYIGISWAGQIYSMWLILSFCLSTCWMAHESIAAYKKGNRKKMLLPEKFISWMRKKPLRMNRIWHKKLANEEAVCNYTKIPIQTTVLLLQSWMIQAFFAGLKTFNHTILPVCLCSFHWCQGKLIIFLEKWIWHASLG